MKSYIPTVILTVETLLSISLSIPLQLPEDQVSECIMILEEKSEDGEPFDQRRTWEITVPYDSRGEWYI